MVYITYRGIFIAIAVSFLTIGSASLIWDHENDIVIYNLERGVTLQVAENRLFNIRAEIKSLQTEIINFNQEADQLKTRIADNRESF
jgi:peptidoglycan hydrolase CwlO-like protein